VPADARFIQADLLDAPRLAEIVGEGYDAVLHFAGLIVVPESVSFPERYYRAIMSGTMNLLDAMRAAGVRRLIFSSTAAVYGVPDRMPITEETATIALSPYGAAKLAVDQMLAFEAAAHGLAAVSMRYFNVAGASGEQGEAHDPETHLIPLVLQAAAGARPSVALYGTDYDTPDGSCVRDYIHVDDLARAHVLALSAMRPGTHRVYNLGNGAGFSNREVIEAARRVTGRAILAVESPRRAGDLATLIASSQRARDELGWVPEKPGLDTMIADAWEWMGRHPHGFA
ncbi:MAG TPA: UDP-glucose 4-epimerase GalE, partial [Ktedonobacterales bacterium]